MARITRRRFLRTAALATGVAAAPQIVPASVFGATGPPPSERVTLGIIGCGNRGSTLRRTFYGLPDAQVVAACDVKPDRRELVANEEKPSHVDIYDDFRELLARDDIDAVVIATQHHTHALLTVMAAKAGKDVYVEKPLSRTIYEGRVTSETIRRHDRVLQVGTQRRAQFRARRTCELVRNQRIGKLHTIRTFVHQSPLSYPPDPVRPAEPAPDGLLWDLFLGPAPWRPYSRAGLRSSDFSRGGITVYGTHTIDIAIWGAAPFLKGPVEIEGSWTPASRPGTGYRATFRYANGITLICETAPYTGIRFEGTEGWIFVSVYGQTWAAQPASLLHSTIGPDEIHLPYPKGTLDNPPQTDFLANDNPLSFCSDFIQAVKLRSDPIAPVESAHQMTSLCLLVWIAVLLRRKLVWDMEKEHFVGDDDANQYLHYVYREPWTL